MIATDYQMSFVKSFPANNSIIDNLIHSYYYSLDKIIEVMIEIDNDDKSLSEGEAIAASEAQRITSILQDTSRHAVMGAVVNICNKPLWNLKHAKE